MNDYNLSFYNLNEPELSPEEIYALQQQLDLLPPPYDPEEGRLVITDPDAYDLFKFEQNYDKFEQNYDKCYDFDEHEPSETNTKTVNNSNTLIDHDIDIDDSDITDLDITNSNIGYDSESSKDFTVTETTKLSDEESENRYRESVESLLSIYHADRRQDAILKISKAFNKKVNVVEDDFYETLKSEIKQRLHNINETEDPFKQSLLRSSLVGGVTSL